MAFVYVMHPNLTLLFLFLHQTRHCFYCLLGAVAGCAFLVSVILSANESFGGKSVKKSPVIKILFVLPAYLFETKKSTHKPCFI
jgi:hypothetical protein